MRTRISRKGKKIVAIALAFAMVLPLTWSQTVVAKAEDTTTQPKESTLAYLALHTDTNDSKDTKDEKPEIEPGKEIKIDIKAAQKIQVTQTTLLDGYLKFESSGYESDELLKHLLIKEVKASSGQRFTWGAAQTGKGYRIEITNVYSEETTFAKDATIATITLEVQRSIDEVTVDLYQMKISAQTVSDSDGSTKSESETNSYTSLKLTNKFKDGHKVVFEMPQGVEGKVSNKYTTELVEVPIKITDNTGFCGVRIQFKYDIPYVQIYDYQLSPEAAKYLKLSTVSKNEFSGVVTLAFVSDTDTYFTGDFLTLRFKVITDESVVDKGIKPTITPDIKALFNISDMSLEKGTMKAEFASGKNTSTITLKKGYQLGDVNMDGSVNLVDVAWVLQSYNGIRVLTSEQTTLGDVNGDGKVSLVDAILILKYVNGEISSDYITKK